MKPGDVAGVDCRSFLARGREGRINVCRIGQQLQGAVDPLTRIAPQRAVGGAGQNRDLMFRFDEGGGHLMAKSLIAADGLRRIEVADEQHFHRRSSASRTRNASSSWKELSSKL